MNSWTERYLAAALRSIPEPKRADVERELRSSIADAVEERVAAGEDRLAAERPSSRASETRPSSPRPTPVGRLT
jgi:hypothetical protein